MVIRASRSGIVPRIRDDEAERQRWTSRDELIERDSVRGVCVHNTMSRSSEKLRFVRRVFEWRKRNSGVSLLVVWLFALTTPSLSIAYTEQVGVLTGTNSCPVECACLGNLVSCSDLQLIEVPSGLPPWTEILWVNVVNNYYRIIDSRKKTMLFVYIYTNNIVLIFL